MMRLDLSAPDYTTLSRRSQHLRRRLRPVLARRGPPSRAPTARVCPSSGQVSGRPRNTVAAVRRGWRKLHLGVDQSGVIRVHTLTEATGDDATTAIDLLTAVEGPLVRVTADAAYDTGARLRDRRGAGCNGRRPTGQDGEHICPRPTVARAGSDDHVGEARSDGASWKKASGYPSSGPGGEYVLPIQVHHRRWPSRPESSWAGE